MASIMKANIDLNKIPKDKIYKGKKGNYLPIVITINDELGNYGDSGPIIVEHTDIQKVPFKLWKEYFPEVGQCS